MFLKKELPLVLPVVPLNTDMGLKEDRKKAGYEPDMNPTASPRANNEGMTKILSMYRK